LKSSFHMIGGFLGGDVAQTRHVDNEDLAIVVVIVSTGCKPLVLAGARVEGAQFALLPVCLVGILGAIGPLCASAPTTTFTARSYFSMCRRYWYWQPRPASAFRCGCRGCRRCCGSCGGSESGATVAIGPGVVSGKVCRSWICCRHCWFGIHVYNRISFTEENKKVLDRRAS